MVLGIVWVFGIGSILAVIFGFVGRKQIRESGGRQSGGGIAMAIAGIVVLGFVGIASLVLWIVLIIAVTTSFNNCFDDVQSHRTSGTAVRRTATAGDLFNSGNTGVTTPTVAPAPSSMGATRVPGALANSATTPGFNVSFLW